MESPTTSDNSTTTPQLNEMGKHSNKSTKKNVETDLKTSIIKFMQSRPFLWDSKHLCYKDFKRRDYEFKMFSEKIGHSVQEIKRVWHVLRTNFFRAHKLLMEKPAGSRENGEKLWKYYTAMSYILTSSSNDSNNSNDDSYSYDGSRKTRNNKEINLSRMYRGSSTNTTPNSFSSDISPIDADNDNLYARSLTLTLKKFDPTTKEIIKLKFQEIIVNYMQQLEQQQSSNQLMITSSETQNHSEASKISDTNSGNSTEPQKGEEQQKGKAAIRNAIAEATTAKDEKHHKTELCETTNNNDNKNT